VSPPEPEAQCTATASGVRIFYTRPSRSPGTRLNPLFFYLVWLLAYNLLKPRVRPVGPADQEGRAKVTPRR